MGRIALFGLLLFVCGCGGAEITKVSGKLTFEDGSPVPNATVTFAPDAGAGPAGVGSTDSSGNYVVGSSLGAGIPAGAYSVKVKSKAQAAKDPGSPMAGLTPGSPEYMEAYKEMMSGRSQQQYKTAKADSNTVPDRYASGGELKAIVDKGGPQTIDFTIER